MAGAEIVLQALRMRGSDNAKGMPTHDCRRHHAAETVDADVAHRPFCFILEHVSAVLVEHGRGL